MTGLPDGSFGYLKRNVLGGVDSVSKETDDTSNCSALEAYSKQIRMTRLKRACQKPACNSPAGADTGTDPTKALTPAEDVDMDKGKDLSNLDEKGKPLESQSLRNVTGSNKTPRQDGELKTENDTETGMLKTETHLRTPSTRSKGKDGAEDASAAQIQTEESRHKS